VKANIKIPGFLRYLLKIFTQNTEHESLLGDLEEVYVTIYNDEGKLRAVLWYFKCVVRLIPDFFADNILWSITMFNNYLKIALRNIMKHKIYSFINIFGLSVGMVCTILIMFWVQDELSYDKFYPDYDKVYRIAYEHMGPNGKQIFSATAPPAVAYHLMNDYPEDIEYMVRIMSPYCATQVKYKEASYSENNVYRAEKDFFNIFQTEFIFGNASGALTGPNKIVITESISRKYFGNTDPTGELLNLDGRYNAIVTGVVKDVPGNSHFRYDFVLSSESSYSMLTLTENWGWYAFHTYCKINLAVTKDKIDSEMSSFIDRHVEPVDGLSGSQLKDFHFQPLASIHLNSNYTIEMAENGSGDQLYIFMVVALLILGLACINFTNLSTARALHRAKEIGLRKVCGASKTQIVRQFFAEAIVVTFVSFILSITIIICVMPWFSNFTEKELSLINADMFSYLIMLSVLVFTGLAAGAYPAIVLSKFQPTTILKGSFKSSGKGLWTRRFFVSLQFVITISLIVSIGVISRQNSYMSEINVGYEKGKMVILNLLRATSNQVSALESNLAKNFDETDCAISYLYPTHVLWAGQDFKVAKSNKVKENEINCRNNVIDYKFIDTYKISMAAGRNFSKDFISDSSACIINETAVRQFGWASPYDALGEYISDSRQELKIIGVTKDIHFESLHNEITPMVFHFGPHTNRSYAFMSVNIGNRNTNEAIETIKSSWEESCSNIAFDYSFLDERYDKLYKNEQKQGSILSLFSGLALVIACLGLIGLVSFAAEEKTKEIGIRKVLGSSVGNIVTIMLKEFAFLILAANIIAWPLAYYYMDSWLQDFAYKTSLGLGVFLISGLAVLGIALLVVSFQATKAALTNPINSLRSE